MRCQDHGYSFVVLVQITNFSNLIFRSGGARYPDPMQGPASCPLAFAGHTPASCQDAALSLSQFDHFFSWGVVLVPQYHARASVFPLAFAWCYFSFSP